MSAHDDRRWVSLPLIITIRRRYCRSMSGSDVAVRRATIDDAGGIAVVHVATWRATYRGLMPQSLLDGRSVEARTAVWWRILREDDGSALVAIE